MTSRTGPGAVPLRAVPLAPDDDDGKRLALVRARWASQDAAVLPRDREAELCIRMLAGRQWDEWDDLRGRFIDPLAYLDPVQREWRLRPKLDYLRLGFQLNLAKLTESPPIITFEPATADLEDAELAETCDVVFKTVATQADMDAQRQRAMGWALATGMGYYKSRIDFTRGPERTLEGPALLRAPRPAAGEAGDASYGGDAGEAGEIDDAEYEVLTEGDVPFGADGTPLASLVPQPDGSWGYEIPEGTEPHREREGEIVVEVIPGPAVRTEWGAGVPLERRRWLIHRSYLSPSDIETRWGVSLDDPTTGAPDSASARAGAGDAGTLETLFFGSGFYATASGTAPGSGGGDARPAAESERWVAVDEMWERPCEAYPAGRLLVCTRTQVLYDGPRPFDCEGAGPFRLVGCLEIPGLPFPTTPFAMAVPVQKAYNRIHAHITEHAAKCSDPIGFVHAQSGVDVDKFTNRPGQRFKHNSPSGVAPLTYISPAPLSPDIWREADELKQHLITLLSIPGSEGKAPTANASGDLVEQLRYNADRAVAALAHSVITAECGLARDWLAMLPTLWPEEKILSVAGDDGLVRTLTVLPQMFEQGGVHVRPVMESMQAGSLAERRAEWKQMYATGMLGDPNDPQVRARFLKLMRYPHLDAMRPGGNDRIMAERNLGQLARGAPADQLAILPQYDLGVHLAVTRDWIAGPSYLRFGHDVQAEIQRHFAHLQLALAAQQRQQAMQASALAASMPPMLGPGGPGGPAGPGAPPAGVGPADGPAPQPFQPSPPNVPPSAGDVAAQNMARAHAGPGAT